MSNKSVVAVAFIPRPEGLLCVEMVHASDELEAIRAELYLIYKREGISAGMTMPEAEAYADLMVTDPPRVAN